MWKEWTKMVGFKKYREIVVEGHMGRGRPQKTWDEVIKGNLILELNAQCDMAQDRVKWKLAFK